MTSQMANPIASQVANQIIDECESTNDLARKLGEEGAPHGTWISARRQSRGRGRLGRTWISDEGHLFLSIIVRPQSASHMTWIPIGTAAAIVNVLSEEFPDRKFEIKWPNDIWLNRAKLGGILCEGFGNQNGSFVVIGVGINCSPISNEVREGLDQSIATLDDQTAADRIRSQIVASVVEMVALLEARGPAPILGVYESHAAFKRGTLVEWYSNKDLKNVVGVGKVLGLGKSGELEVINAEGETHALWAEDVKLRIKS